jgi:hypothetical protein
MNQNNKRARNDETNNTSNANKKSKGEDENERLRQENERHLLEIERQQQKIERQQQEIERQREENEQLRHYIQCKMTNCSTCQHIECNDGQHVSVPCIHCGDLGSFYRGQSTLQETVDFLRDFPGKKPIILDRNEANQWTKDVPEELWLGEIMPYFSVKELSLGGTIATHFQKYWVTFKSNRKLCVPKDFPSLSEAVHVGEILSRRGIISSTNENLLKIMLSNGVYHEGIGYIQINYPVSIIGESRDGCKVIGGLQILGEKEDNVYVKDLTLWKANGHGVLGDQGASFHLDNVSVENSVTSGVVVFGTKRNTMKNCQVSHSNESGLYLDCGGLMTISGNATTIHHNCMNIWNFGKSLDDYGLDVFDSFSSIHLASSLTIEISTDNEDGQNYGGDGTIKSVDKDGKVLEVVYDGRSDEEDEDEGDY